MYLMCVCVWRREEKSQNRRGKNDDYSSSLSLMHMNTELLIYVYIHAYLRQLLMDCWKLGYI